VIAVIQERQPIDADGLLAITDAQENSAVCGADPIIESIASNRTKAGHQAGALGKLAFGDLGRA
jgi:hypothetical protein